MLLAGLRDRSDRVGEVPVLELAGDAERAAEIEMADPQAVDALERGDRIGVLDPLAGLDLGEQRGPRLAAASFSSVGPGI